MVFCNKKGGENVDRKKRVTILILIDGFLQYDMYFRHRTNKPSHNPYFNRWFSAIRVH